MDTMTNAGPRPDYADHVSRVLTAGEVDLDMPAKWIDYRARYELGPEHVPALIQLACAMDLHRGDEQGPELWAPMRAWRALGQWRAVEVVEPLLAAL